MKKTSANWLLSSQYDLRTAGTLLINKRYIYVVFMCHLALEKTLKAVLSEKFKGLPPYTHNLNRLIELGIVVKNGDFYCFKDKLLKYWIKFVYQKRLRDVELAPDKQRKQYKEEFHKLIDDFNVTSRKDLSSRIVELFNCFDNEAFSLNGKKYRLPLFRTVEPFRFKNESGIYFDMIKASSENDQWFVVVKKDNVGETDINTVMSEVKKLTKRIDRCLIISLTGLDENARIRALEEKFWIWNEGELNTLLTLFDKPYIL